MLLGHVHTLPEALSMPAKRARGQARLLQVGQLQLTHSKWRETEAIQEQSPSKGCYGGQSVICTGDVLCKAF